MSKPEKTLSKKGTPWSPEEVQFLTDNYPERGKLFCVEKLQRTEPSVRVMAYILHLTSKLKNSAEANKKKGISFRGKKRPQHSKLLKERHFVPANYFTDETRKKMSISQKKAIKEGRLTVDKFRGHRHTEEAKRKMSEASRRMWADPTCVLNSEKYKQQISDRMSKLQQEKPRINRYSRGRGSHEIIGEKKLWLRSTWEVVYARYLQFLLEKKMILSWEYEPETFWFLKIKRGVRSYRPDFRIKNLDGSIEYHEVKGWMDQKSKTKLARMKIYYPEVKLVVIGATEFKEIRKWERLFPDTQRRLVAGGGEVDVADWWS